MEKELLFEKRYGEREFFERFAAEPSEAERRDWSAARPALMEAKPGGSASAEAFMANAEAFSKKYEVSADIFRCGAGAEVWLYFAEETLTGGKKRACLELANAADEAQIIPRTGNMPAWCSFALVLNRDTQKAAARRE